MKDYGRRLQIARVVCDMVMTIASWAVALLVMPRISSFALPHGWCATSPLCIGIAMCSCVVTLVLQGKAGMYKSETCGLAKELWRTLCSCVGVFVVLVCVCSFAFPEYGANTTLLAALGLQFLLVSVVRLVTALTYGTLVRKGLHCRNVLLVGDGKALGRYMEQLSRDCRSNMVVKGQFLARGMGFEGVSQIQADDLAGAVSLAKANVVVISTAGMSAEESKEILSSSLGLFGQKVFVIPDIPTTFVGTEASMYGDTPLVRLNSYERPLWGSVAKRAFDIVSCSIGVILLSPLFIAIAILVKATSKGPVFFRQRRVTRDGKVFEMLKFRSMRTDMPEGDPHLTPENDPRVTRIGRFIRKTSLDEIPQFFNVIGGSMSLIGPRPERPELEEQFRKTIPGYYMRHKMKAGISGWAQVNGLRGNTSIEKRVEYDLYYIRNWSFLFDMKVVIFTFFKGFINKNAY